MRPNRCGEPNGRTDRCHEGFFCQSKTWPHPLQYPLFEEPNGKNRCWRGKANVIVELDPETRSQVSTMVPPPRGSGEAMITFALVRLASTQCVRVRLGAAARGRSHAPFAQPCRCRASFLARGSRWRPPHYDQRYRRLHRCRNVPSPNPHYHT